MIVDGTLEVFSIIGATGYTAHLEELGIDLAGDVVVPKGNTLKITGGPIRVGGHAINGTVGDAWIRGGGIVDIEETDGDAYDPEHPLLPDGTMKFIEDGEKLTLADDTVLRLGPYSEVSGIGSIVGKGSVTLAGTTVRGRLTIADGVPATTEPGTQTAIQVWDRDLPGQTGLLTPAGDLRVEPGSTVRVHGRRRTPRRAQGRDARAPGRLRPRLRRLLLRHRPGDPPEGRDDEDRRGRRRPRRDQLGRARRPGHRRALRVLGVGPGGYDVHQRRPDHRRRAPSPATCLPGRPRSGRAAS